MFTTVCQQANDINWGKNQEEKLEIVRPDLNFGSMAADEILISSALLNMNLNDMKNLRYNLKCCYSKFRIVPACISKQNSNYYSPEKLGYIWEVKNSELIKKIKSKEIEEEWAIPSIENAKHFVLPLKDKLIEIVTNDLGSIRKTDETKIKDLSYHKSEKTKKLSWVDYEVPFSNGFHKLLSNFEFNSTPFEQLTYNKSGLEICLDDRQGQRYRIIFDKCLNVDVTEYELASLIIPSEYCGRNKAGYFLDQIPNSKLIEKLKNRTNDPKILEQLNHAKHFILTLRDSIIQVIAEDISLEQVS